MSRDLKTVPLDELVSERDAGIAKIREIRAAQVPLDEEIARRSNGQTFVLNSVIEGKHAALLAAGVPEAVVSAAQLRVERIREAKHAARAEKAVQS